MSDKKPFSPVNTPAEPKKLRHVLSSALQTMAKIEKIMAEADPLALPEVKVWFNCRYLNPGESITMSKPADEKLAGAVTGGSGT